MKHLVMILVLFGSFAYAAHASDWCDIQDKATGAVQQTYEGTCNQRKFGGPWGDPTMTTHVPNKTRQAQLDAEKAAAEALNAKISQRVTTIRTECAKTADTLLAALCAQILNQ